MRVPRRGAFVGSWACGCFSLLLIAVLLSPSWASASEGVGGDVYAPPSVPAEPVESGAPACPGDPAEYHGEDEVVASVYGSQLLDVELCRVLHHDLVRVSERQFWQLDEEVAAGAQRAEGLELLSGLAELPSSGSGDGGPELAAISAQTEAVESSGTHTLQALYILIGAMLGLFVLSLLRELLRSAG